VEHRDRVGLHSGKNSVRVPTESRQKMGGGARGGRAAGEGGGGGG
jgi:hypothetical protein